MAIIVWTGSMIKMYCGMVCFLGFLWENNFLYLFGYIWVKIHFPLISPFVNFNEILVHNLCRKQRIINGRKSDVYTKKSKGRSIESCETPAKTGDQFKGLTVENYSLEPITMETLKKVCANCLKFQVSSLYNNPLCQTLSKAFEMPKKLALTSSEGLWSDST